MKMFFSILIVYMICSFITLLLYMFKYIRRYDVKTNKELPISNLMQVLLSIYWPLTMVMVYKSIKAGKIGGCK